ncbi:MAG TPA: flagellar protein FlaG [Methylotenera sp.]|nr:flagellar protein FlaG [Methylotenera sp.]
MDIDNLLLSASPAKSVAGDFSSLPVAKPAIPERVVAATESNASQGQELGQQQLQEAVSRLNDYVQNVQRSIRFSVDDVSGKDVVTVLDKQTEEVIRQIPIEEVLVFARNLAEQNDGDLNLFSSTA